MRLLRMIGIAWRLAWPHVLTPWRSPVIRWRMETYGWRDASGRLKSAPDMTAGDLYRFLALHGKSVREFLRWGATL